MNRPQSGPFQAVGGGWVRPHPPPPPRSAYGPEDRQTDRHVCLFGVLYNKYTSTLTKFGHFHMSHNPFRVGGQPVEEMYGIMTKISSVSSQNQLLMLKNAPEFTKIMMGEICTSL